MVGASQGLGLAITRELRARTKAHVVAVSRSRVPAADRLRPVEADITQAASRQILANAIADLPGPLAVIMNAAAVLTDIRGPTIAFDVFHRVNATQIDGLGHVLEATLGRLAQEGGAFVAISSFAAYAPPIQEPRIAYPATKAYLDMAIRALRLQWGEQIVFTTVHLGNMAEDARGILCPSYAAIATRLVDRFAAGRFPREINATWPYLAAYKWCFPLLGDRFYARLMRRLFPM